MAFLSRIYFFNLVVWFVAACQCAQAQYTFTGRVTDAETGEGMPFATVAFKGTTIGTTTDFDGFYKLTTQTIGDSLSASAISYATRSRWVDRSKKTQVLDFQLSPSAISLLEVKI